MGLLFDRPSFFDDAKCRGSDPNLFFPGHGESPRKALEICEGCPVSEPCFEYAMRNGETEGVWGGRTGGIRRRAGVFPVRLLVCGICGQKFVVNGRSGGRHKYCSDECRYVAKCRNNRKPRRVA